MKINSNFKIMLGATFILSIVIVAVFGRLIGTFYQQDEWHSLGLALSQGINSIFPGSFKPIDLILVKGRLLSTLIFYFFAVNFPLQNAQMAVFAIVLHIIAAFLVFFLINKFIKNSLLSLLGSIFFAVNAVSHGAVTWPVIAISAIIPTIFILLATIFFFKYIDIFKSKWLILTWFMLYISLWFKESGLYLFIFFPFSALLFKTFNPISFIKRFWFFILPFFLIVGYRVLELKMRTTDSNLYLTGADDNFFLTILIRAVLYPLSSFSLMFIPGKDFLSLAREVLRDNYPFFANAPNNVLVSQSVILDLLSIVLTGFILSVIFFFIKNSPLEIRKSVVFWLAFTLLSFTPYVVLGKDFSYLESRYYYLPVVGAAVILSLLLSQIWQTIGKKLFLICILPFFLVFVFWHAVSVSSAIEEQVIWSTWRKDFMTELNILVPTLTKNKNIFYITSDKNYWADGNRIPFQQGSGYTIMVLYYDSGKIPKEFLQERYLFEIASQGYKEIGKNGFGYFSNKEDLDEAVKLYNLPQTSIISLRYDSKEKKLIRQNND